MYEDSTQRKPQGPARWGVVGMHTAAPAALWAAWDEFTCAGAALVTTFFSKAAATHFSEVKPFVYIKAPGPSGQTKSRVTPRGDMKAARSVNHRGDRGLPGGGGLWLCMRRLGSIMVRVSWVSRAGATQLAIFPPELRVLASLLCVRVRTRHLSSQKPAFSTWGSSVI